MPEHKEEKVLSNSTFQLPDKTIIEIMHDRILIEPSFSSSKSKSGLAIPDSINKEEQNQGKVVAFGSKKVSNKLEKGVSIIYRDRAVDNIKIKDKHYIIIKEDDVLAILK